MTDDPDQPTPEWTQAQYEEFMRIEAEGLANLRGLDPARVLAVFHRLAEAGWLWPNFPRNTALDQAVLHAGPEDALELFETVDLVVIMRRYYCIDYLRDPLTPFHSLDELGDLTEAFLSHLESNRGALLRTGLPETNFIPSLWLDWHVNKLYPTRLRTGPDGAVGLLPGLSAADAARIENLREAVLGIKQRVLAVLLDCIRRANGEAPWAMCRDILATSLRHYEVRLLVRAEGLYTELGVGAPPVHGGGTGFVDVHPSGLLDLLNVIGHYEQEMTIGAMDTARLHLMQVPRAADFTCYFDAVGEPWQQAVDTGLEAFWKADLKARVFWKKHARRIESSLSEYTAYLPPSDLDSLRGRVAELEMRMEGAQARGPAVVTPRRGARSASTRKTPVKWNCPRGTLLVLDGPRTWLKWEDGRAPLGIKSNSHARYLLDYFALSSTATSDQLRNELVERTGKPRKTPPNKIVRTVNHRLASLLRAHPPTRDIPEDVICGTGGVYGSRIPVKEAVQLDDWDEEHT